MDRFLTLGLVKLKENVVRRRRQRRMFVKIIYAHYIHQTRAVLNKLRNCALSRRQKYLQLLNEVDKVKRWRLGRIAKLVRKCLRKWVKILPKHKLELAVRFYRRRILSSYFGELVRFSAECKQVETNASNAAILYHRISKQRSFIALIRRRFAFKQELYTYMHFIASRFKRKRLKSLLKRWKVGAKAEFSNDVVRKKCRAVLQSLANQDVWYYFRKWLRQHRQRHRNNDVLIHGYSSLLLESLRRLKARVQWKGTETHHQKISESHEMRRKLSNGIEKWKRKHLSKQETNSKRTTGKSWCLTNGKRHRLRTGVRQWFNFADRISQAKQFCADGAGFHEAYLRRRGLTALKRRADKQIFLKDRESELCHKSKDSARKRVLLKLIVLLKRRFAENCRYNLLKRHLKTNYLMRRLIEGLDGLTEYRVARRCLYVIFHRLIHDLIHAFHSKHEENMRRARGHRERWLLQSGFQMLQLQVGTHRDDNINNTKANYFFQCMCLSRFYSALTARLAFSATNRSNSIRAMAFWKYRRYLIALDRFKLFRECRKKRRARISEAFQYYDDSVSKDSCRVLLQHCADMGTSNMRGGKINPCRLSWLVRKCAMKWLSVVRQRWDQRDHHMQTQPHQQMGTAVHTSVPAKAVCFSSPLMTQLALSLHRDISAVAPPAIPTGILVGWNENDKFQANIPGVSDEYIAKAISAQAVGDAMHGSIDTKAISEEHNVYYRQPQVHYRPSSISTDNTAAFALAKQSHYDVHSYTSTIVASTATVMSNMLALAKPRNFTHSFIDLPSDIFSTDNTAYTPPSRHFQRSNDDEDVSISAQQQRRLLELEQALNDIDKMLNVSGNVKKQLKKQLAREIVTILSDLGTVAPSPPTYQSGVKDEESQERGENEEDISVSPQQQHRLLELEQAMNDVDAMLNVSGDVKKQLKQQLGREILTIISDLGVCNA